MSDKLIDECQKVIGYKFKDVNLLELSLTHSSYAITKDWSFLEMQCLN